MKPIIIASLVASLLAGCGSLKKKEEVGPYGDKRSRLQKLSTFEEERYDSWADKWMHRDQYKRRKRTAPDKQFP